MMECLDRFEHFLHDEKCQRRCENPHSAD
jgi:hypothetical protein